MFEEIGTFGFHPHQRDKFRDGSLASSWAKQYPQLFDDQDLRLSMSQNVYHFFEWLGAILLFNTTGYLSLVEKYEFKRHKRKQGILKQIMSSEVLDLIQNKDTQCPDLLAYAPDRSGWFFCEVKGPGDRLTSAQKHYFGDLSRLTEKPIRIIKFREIKT